MSLVMGFFEDFRGFLYRMPQTLIFSRNSVNVNKSMFVVPQDCAAHKISLSIKDVVWRIPHIKFNIASETKIRNEILKNTAYQMEFRNWQYLFKRMVGGVSEYTHEIPAFKNTTKFAIIGFQTARDTDGTKDSSRFDLCDLESVQIQLNDIKLYPRERLSLKVNERRTGALYEMYKQFKYAYYEESTLYEPLVDYNTFIAKYPLIALDCSHQPVLIKESLINVKIHFTWRTNVPENTIIHMILITDRKIIYNPLHNRVIG